MEKIISYETYEQLTEVDPIIWVVDDVLEREFCEKVIAKFEQDTRKEPGKTLSGLDEAKKSTDLHISGLPGWEQEDAILHESLTKQIQDLRAAINIPVLNFGEIFNYDVGHQIQRFSTNQYYNWHCEHTPGLKYSGSRTMTYMWYLNHDTIEGGETGFLRQNIKITPKQGRLVFFSPEWTHTHCCHRVNAGNKYIITGWLHHA